MHAVILHVFFHQIGSAAAAATMLPSSIAATPSPLCKRSIAQAWLSRCEHASTAKTLLLLLLRLLGAFPLLRSAAAAGCC
jgi:hypothetical protein